MEEDAFDSENKGKAKITEEFQLDSFWAEWEVDEDIEDIDSEANRNRKRKMFPKGTAGSPPSPSLDSSSPSSSATLSPSDWVLDFDDVLMMPESPISCIPLNTAVSPASNNQPSTSPRRSLCPRDLSTAYPLLVEPGLQLATHAANVAKKVADDLNHTKFHSQATSTTVCSVRTQVEAKIAGPAAKPSKYELIVDDEEDDEEEVCSLDLNKPLQSKKTKAQTSDARKRKRCPPQALNKKKKSSRSKTKTNELEDLLFAISHLLPRDRLPGVVSIIPRQYCSSTDDGLTFDINALDKHTIQLLEEYVNSCLCVKPRTTAARNPGPTLKSGAFKKASTNNYRSLRNDGSFLDSSHVFQVEEIVTIKQTKEGNEDEEVDIGDLFDG
jgi:hypothetical protein